MKPIRLSLQGLNSFKEQQSIEFDKLTQYGLFGVFGPTGSGKSTLLDGMTLALYGKTSRESSNFIHVEADKMQVVFEFGVKDKIYRVVRSYRRNKQGSINASKPTRIEDITDKPIVLEEQTKHVDNKCLEIIGLEFKDFIRTVVLPQGKFSEFINLKGKDRREMLERLFSLSRYGDELSRKLSSTIRREKDKSLDLEGQMKGYEHVSNQALRDLKETLSQCLEEGKQVKIQLDHKKALYDKQVKIFELNGQIESLKVEQAQLNKKEEEINHIKEQILLGQRILEVKPYYDRWVNDEKTVEETRLSIGDLEKDIEPLKDQVVLLEKDFQATKDKYDLFMTSYEVNKLKLNEAISLQDQASVLKTKSHTIGQVIAQVQTKKEAAQVQYEQVLKDSQVLESKKVVFEHTLKENLVPLELQRHIDEGVKLENQIDQIENTMKSYQLEDDLKVIESLKEELETFEPKKTKLLDQVASCGIQSTEDYLNKVQMISKEMHEAKEMARQKESLKGEIHQVNKAISEIEETYKAYMKRKDQAFIHKLQSHLVEGEACPVCGSHEHNYQLSFESFESDINLEQDMDTLQFKLKSKEEAYDQIKTFDKKVIQRLESEKEGLEKTYMTYQALEKSLLEMKQKRLSLEERISLLSEDYKKKKENFDELLEAKKGLTGQLKALNHNQIEGTYSDYKKEIFEKLDRYEESKKGLDQLKLQLDMNQEAIASFKESLSSLDLELSLKKQEKNNLLDALKNIEDKRFTLFDLDLDLKQKLNELNKRYDDLNHGYKSQAVHLDKQKSKLKILNDDLIRLKAILESGLKSLETIEKTLETYLSKNDLTHEQMKNHTWTKEMLMDKSAYVAAYKEQKSKIDTTLTTLIKQMDGQVISKEALENLSLELESVQKAHKVIYDKSVRLEKDIESMTDNMSKLKDLVAIREAVDYKLSLLKDLESLFKGKKFVEFVASYQLRYISIEASKRLYDITSGKYGLEVDDHGMFLVRDYSNGGQTRDMSTLSGGESFLVSLCLALSLSSQIQLKGTAPLELFFLDEGFGTLDERFLELVMSSLERIHHDNLSIGLISHVDSIKSRVPIKLMVSPSISGERGSRVKIEKT